jgi:ABC-type Mn2+/Zn2+ transport system ATPase subunit
MRYKSFRVKNFKGIKDTTITLEGIGGASVFALVGLNESGKTTVLEAIHSFSPDSDTGELVGGDERKTVPFRARVPRHLLSSFTGDVSVEATLSVSRTEKERIIPILEAATGLALNPETFPDEVRFERFQRFEGGDFKKSYFSLRTNIEVREKGKKKWRAPSREEREKLKFNLYGFTPDIAYSHIYLRLS